MIPPTQAQIDAARRELVGLVVITGDSTWDMDYVARRVLEAAAQAEDDRLKSLWKPPGYGPVRAT